MASELSSYFSTPGQVFRERTAAVTGSSFKSMRRAPRAEKWRREVHPSGTKPERKLSFAFVALDYTILNIHDTVGVLGDVMLVGDEHDGVALGVQAIH